MKQNKPFLLSIATALLTLSSCGGGNGPAKTLLEQMRDALSEHDNNVTMVADQTTNKFYSSNAFFYDFSEVYERDYGYVDCGYLKSPQGVFKFFLDENGCVELDHCESVSEEIETREMTVYPERLFRDLSAWSHEEGSLVYESSDSLVRKVAANLGGDADYVSSIKDLKLTFASADSIENAVLSYSLYGETLEMRFYDFGKTSDSFIDSFMANPVILETPSAYPSAMKKRMNEVLHQELPLYKISYANSYDAEYQTIYDLGCGNIVEDMDLKLSAKGFLKDPTRCKELKDSKGNQGFVDYVYYLPIRKDGVIVAVDFVEVGYVSGCYFDDSAYTDGIYEKAYPKGRASLTFTSYDYYTASSYSAFIKKLASDYGGFGEGADLILSENPYMAMTDYTEMAQYLSCYCYYMFESSYEDEEKLAADLSAYKDALEAVGYNNYYGNEVGDGAVCMFINNDDYSLNITMDYTPGSTSFSFTVFVTDKVLVGEPLTWAAFLDYINSAKTRYPALPGIPDGMETLEEVTFADLTEEYKSIYEDHKASKVMLGYFFNFDYGNAEKALANAKVLAASFDEAGWTKSPSFTFEEDDCVFYSYDGEKYSFEITVLVEGGAVSYFMMAYIPNTGYNA